MDISVKTTHEEHKIFQITFDEYGGLYFSDQSSTYQVNVSAKNTLYADKGNYTINSKTNIARNNFKLVEREHSLKRRVNEAEYDDDEEDEDDDEYQNIEKYYPEDLDYTENLDNNSDDDVNNDGRFQYDRLGDYIIEENIEMYGIDNKKFIFSSSMNDEIVYSRVDGDISALYDTYIYDDTDQLRFKSNSQDDSSIFRLKLYMSGTILFREIGGNEACYELSFDGETIHFSPKEN